MTEFDFCNCGQCANCTDHEIDEEGIFTKNEYSDEITDEYGTVIGHRKVETIDLEPSKLDLIQNREECQKCGLHENAQSPCIIGNLPKIKRGIKYFFIGEAPGDTEDAKNVVFCGQAGGVLRQLLSELKFPEDETYISNTVKCYPDRENVTPKKKEVDCCREFLLNELALLLPKNIILLGKVAMEGFGFKGGVKNFRQQILSIDKANTALNWVMDASIFITYHPAYVLYQPTAWDDLKSDFSFIKQNTEELAEKKEKAFYELYTPSRYQDYINLNKIKNQVIAFDIETSSLDHNTFKTDQLSNILGLGISLSKNSGICIEASRLLLKELTKFFENNVFVAHNLKFDWKFLYAKEGLNPPLEHFCDTMVMAFLLNENESNYKLKRLAGLVGMSGYDRLLKIPIDQLENHPIEEWFEYNAADADVTRRLFEYYSPKIKELGLEKLTKMFSMGQVVAGVMELNGIMIDNELLQEYEEQMDIKLEEIEKALRDEILNLDSKNLSVEMLTYIKRDPEIRVEVNFNSNQQVADILEHGFNLELTVKTPKGKSYSITQEILLDLIQKYPENEFVKNIFIYRKLQKVKSVYIEGIKRNYESETGRVYPRYYILGTPTGRFSCSQPNLQQTLKTVERKDPASEHLKYFNIRNLVTVPEGKVMVSIDYSQLELRILAVISKDESLLRCFEEGLDIHQMTADFLNVERADAKAVNFGIPYGGDEYTILRHLRSKGYPATLRQAQAIFNKFMTSYYGVKNYFDIIRNDLKEHQMVKNYYGMMRRFPNWKFARDNEKNRIFNQAVNFPIQSTAANIILEASIEIVNNLFHKPELGMLIGNVHDELLFEVPEENLNETISLVKEIMEGIEFPIELPVDVSIGKCWGSLEEYKNIDD